MPATVAGGPVEAADALEHLREITPQMLGCAILDSEGDVLAASGGEHAWAHAARGLIAAADATGPGTATHAHVATEAGEAFMVREGGYAAVAVTERFVLGSLVLFDLRSALRELEALG